MKKHEIAEGKRASELIDRRIEELGGWRGKVLAQVRALIQKADPEIVEEWKWMGTPVWSHDGIVCTGEAYKQVVKLTFARGAELKDPDGLFNSSLDGNTRRAIDIHEGEKINKAALRALVRDAAALNSSTIKRRKRRLTTRSVRASTTTAETPTGYGTAAATDSHRRDRL
jgi:hypothetical protein